MTKTNLLAIMCAGAATLASCGADGGRVAVRVGNSLPFERCEMVELSLAEAQQKVGAERVAVYDSRRRAVPSQTTYDSLLIFQAQVPPSGSATYYLGAAADDQTFDTLACGKVYPRRDDDLAWENDLVGFRAYGPALQRRGEKGFGYDLFLKRDTAGPILEMLYAGQLDPENWKIVNSLRAEGKHAEADSVQNSFTYHVDHGYGMDCYSVGATLGCGITAPLVDGSIVFPWCYDRVEILDNGPLRFTAALAFTPMAIGADTVVEHRLISLDAGTHLNRTTVSYEGLESAIDIATGFAVKNGSEAVTSGTPRHIAYVDPTQGPDNGKVFVGCVFTAPALADTILAAPDSYVALSTLAPGSEFSYLWGFGWDRSDVASLEAWNEILEKASQAIDSPLTVTF